MIRPDVILIIDDEDLLRMSLRTLLEDLGYRVVEAASGGEGLEACSREPPDLVLLDARMPGMDGFETCARLHQTEAFRELPVIFLSGMMETQEKVKAFQAGAVDYMTKPYHIAEVEARVQTHLEIQRQRRRLAERNDELQQALSETEVLNRKLIELNENLRQSEELKSRFLANVRNEFNNPLSAIMAIGREIADPALGPERIRLLAGTITAEAFGLDFQIRNIFCAAELEAGESSPSITHVDVPSVLRDVLDSFSQEAVHHSVELDLQAPGDGAMRLWTDAEKLRVIAGNLISNAIKFNQPEGKVLVRAVVRNNELVLEVEDTGPGIPPADRTLIFQRFRQLQTGSSRAYLGHGLGLSVAKALVDLLEGTLAVGSGTSRGSVFTCRLPGCPEPPADPTSAFDGNLFFFDDTDAK